MPWTRAVAAISASRLSSGSGTCKAAHRWRNQQDRLKESVLQIPGEHDLPAMREASSLPRIAALHQECALLQFENGDNREECSFSIQVTLDIMPLREDRAFRLPLCVARKQRWFERYITRSRPGWKSLPRRGGFKSTWLRLGIAAASAAIFPLALQFLVFLYRQQTHALAVRDP